MAIKNENYIVTHGWMINDLKLKGNDLTVYAVIYGFTQDGEQWFEGNRQYLADWCNSTKRGIQDNLRNLLEKNLIIKQDIIINNVKFCKYKTNLNFDEIINKINENIHPGKENTPQCKKFPTPSAKSSLPPREESSPNNIYNNNIDNNIDNNININNDFSSKKNDSLQIEYEKKLAFYHISKILKLKYGQPTPKHIEFSNKWLDELKIPDYKIIEAGNKCIESIGKINFAYIDKILTTPPKQQTHSYNKHNICNGTNHQPSYDLDEIEKWQNSDEYDEYLDRIFVKQQNEIKEAKKKREEENKKVIEPIDTWDYLDSLDFEIT